MTSAPVPVHFLLVDDLEQNLLALEALLERAGLVLLKARTGEEALELLLRHEIALALLDVQMPGMDGFELAEMMRGTERTRRIPIIFVTAGSADRQRRFRGYEAGAVDFLQKPIEPDVLRGKANVFFELARQRLQIAAQNDELKAYAGALRDADRRKDEFIAILAHELRNPLAPLSNGLRLLNEGVEAERAGAVRDMMERQLTHLVRLIDDLLDVSRISEGKIELRRGRIDIGAIAEAAIELSKPLLEAGGHSFEFIPADGPLFVDADATRLAQVVSNLLNNAAKYTPPKGEIALRVFRREDCAVVEVSDNGIGVDAPMLPKIFELFTQADPTTESAKSGLGIGLALAKRLVQMHGGSISAASEGGGRGSTFAVRLPLDGSASPRSADPEAEEAAPPGARSLRVLVVDDNFDVAQTVGWLLEAIGHDYRIANDGPSALEAAGAFDPDAIVLDIGLPGMDGFAVCRALRADPRHKHTLIIAQTGWGQEGDRRRTAEAGFDIHLVKPVGIAALESALATAAVKSLP